MAEADIPSDRKGCDAFPPRAEAAGDMIAFARRALEEGALPVFFDSPRKVLLNHGRRDFVHRLRAIGVAAEYMEEHAQLALF